MKRTHSESEAESSKMASKKLINTVDKTVDEALEGLASSNPNVSLIDNHRVVVRSDLENLRGKVAILGGGGSGHEPAFSGYVGKGCMSAAIAGSVFASPPPTAILAGLLKLAENNPSGVLVVVYNYTGDRVNFGLAVEKAKALINVSCEMFVVADDTALTSADRTAGRRGLCGGKLVLKIAGAMSEQGKSLDEILELLNTKVAPNLGTINLSLGPCTVPGRTSASFSLGDDEMELGLGMHGEAGVKRIKVASAKDSVKALLAHMTNHNSSTHLTLKQGDFVAVMLNNLGAISSLEMGILANEVHTQLESNYKVSIRRFYSGPFFTSLEMPGFSITVLRLTASEIVNYLDAEALCTGWSGQSFPRRLGDKRPKLTDPMLKLKNKEAQGPECDKFCQEVMIKAISFACEAVMSCEDQLNTMDSGSGDSDCGSTLKRGAEAVLKNLKKSLEVASRFSSVLRLIGTAAESDMGGSSGAMYSILFETAAVSIGACKTVTASNVGLAFQSGLNAVMKYGRASPGDRTMIDALLPAIQAFQRTLDENKSTLEAVEAATCAAENGAISTLNMKASAGRASYVSSSELKHPDPGAHAVGIIMRALFEGYKIKESEYGRNN